MVPGFALAPSRALATVPGFALAPSRALATARPAHRAGRCLPPLSMQAAARGSEPGL
jgi:hypothetical protein